MSKTMADHARAYRQRKAAKLARLAVLEEALRRAADEFDLIVMRLKDGQDERAAGAALCGAKDARSALNHTTEAREDRQPTPGVYEDTHRRAAGMGEG